MEENESQENDTDSSNFNQKLFNKENIIILDFEGKNDRADTNGLKIHNKLKSAHRKRSDVAEIPIWVEQSYKYRRERIKNSADYFIDMLLEFINLTDIKYVS